MYHLEALIKSLGADIQQAECEKEEELRSAAMLAISCVCEAVTEADCHASVHGAYASFLESSKDDRGKIQAALSDAQAIYDAKRVARKAERSEAESEGRDGLGTNLDGSPSLCENCLLRVSEFTQQPSGEWFCRACDVEAVAQREEAEEYDSRPQAEIVSDGVARFLAEDR